MSDELQPIDLRRAAGELAGLVTAVRDDQLDLPTPCPDYAVGELLGHIDDLSQAFTAAAAKERSAGVDEPPPTPVAVTGDWRGRIPTRLTELGEAWRDPAAWMGMTKAGGIDMPGSIAGTVALDEIVVHGWDLAVATGQPFTVDDDAVAGASAFAAMITDDNRGDAFGRPVHLGPGATPIERLVAATGRDPAWRPARSR